MIEEYVRFGLNHEDLSARAKQLRHRLSSAVGSLGLERLLACRDSQGDVGADLHVDQQITRVGLDDCLTAAHKRLSEALRVLAEVAHTENSSVARTLQALRFEAYTLEKDILLKRPLGLFSQVALYVIISSDLPAEALSLTAQCIKGGADCVQLRNKGLDDRTRFELSRQFVQICRAAQVLSIINDRVDLAVACEAHGVHLGHEDVPVSVAHQCQISPLIIGCTTHDMETLEVACQEGPTYAAVGPAFATVTKPQLRPAGLDYITQAIPRLAHLGIGHVAIGGITLDNVAEVLAAGARTIAVCSAVTHASDPVDVCKRFKEIITRTRSHTNAG